MILKYTLNGLPHEVKINQKAVTLGRSAQCDIPLDDPGCLLSRKHARIYVENGIWKIMDLGSHNGTWLEGQRLVSNIAYPLKPQAGIVLGRILVEPIFSSPPIADSPAISQLSRASGDSLGVLKTEKVFTPSTFLPLPELPEEKQDQFTSDQHGLRLREMLQIIMDHAETLSEDDRLAYLIEVFTEATQDIRGTEIGRFMRAVLRR